MKIVASMENVIKRYGHTNVVDGLNLEVREGEIMGLLGPNGAGKTTSISILTGLINANNGLVTVFGEEQHVNNLEIKRKLGLVTQDITLFRDLNGIGNLKYFGGLYGLKGKELDENIQRVLDFVELTDHAKKYPSQLSGGMQRRLNIAVSLIHNPKLLILDEPTVGIDPQSRNHILDSVKRLKENGTTVIYTTHYMEEVEQIADQVTIMDEGRLIAKGTITELIGKVTHEETHTITVANPFPELKQQLNAISGVKSVNQDSDTYRVTSATGSGNLNRILEIMTKGGIVKICSELPNLEDVFLTLTGKTLRDEVN